MEEITSLNNQAIQLVQSGGNHQEAIDLLIQLITRLRVELLISQHRATAIDCSTTVSTHPPQQFGQKLQALPRTPPVSARGNTDNLAERGTTLHGSSIMLDAAPPGNSSSTSMSSSTRRTEEQRQRHNKNKKISLVYSAVPLPIPPCSSSTMRTEQRCGAFLFNKVFKVSNASCSFQQQPSSSSSSCDASTYSSLTAGTSSPFAGAGVEDHSTTLHESQKFYDVEQEDSTSHILKVLTTFVVYNLAIIHHLQYLEGTAAILFGTRMTNTSASHLEKAKKLYQLCLKSLEDFDDLDANSASISTIATTGGASGTTSFASISTIIHILKVIAYNNLAQLFLEQKEQGGDQGLEKNVKECLLRLYHLIMVTDYYYHHEYYNSPVSASLAVESAAAQVAMSQLLSNEDYDGIISNMILLHQTAIAAAAA